MIKIFLMIVIFALLPFAVVRALVPVIIVDKTVRTLPSVPSPAKTIAKPAPAAPAPNKGK